MKKNCQKGFMLVETLVVTTFIAGVFIFLFIQFNNLNKSYKNSFKYDTVEGSYALEDILDYLRNETRFTTNINSYMNSNEYVDITECSSELFINTNYCKKLFELENIKQILVVDYNNVAFENNEYISENIKEYFNKVNKKNLMDCYVIVAEFKNGSVSSNAFIKCKNGNCNINTPDIKLIEGNSFEIGSIYRITSNDVESDWYVIANSNTSITFLSKYNLSSSDNYLKQAQNNDVNDINFDNATSRLTDNNTYCKLGKSESKGCNAYAASTLEGSIFTNGSFSGTVTEDSTIKTYNDKYVNTLNLGNYLVSNRLIQISDLTNLGCKTSSYKSAECKNYTEYTWLYSTSYWLMTPHTGPNQSIYMVSSSGVLSNTASRYWTVAGIRPVIVIKKEGIK